MEELKLVYKNGNEIICKNVNDFHISDDNLYISEYDSFRRSNQMAVISLIYIESITAKLDNMPFDKNGKHATGYSTYIVEDGRWWDEYED